MSSINSACFTAPKVSGYAQYQRGQIKVKPKKDVLFLCQFFYPEYNSSATLPADTAFFLAENGVSVDVMCGYPKEYTKEREIPIIEEVNGVLIHRIKYLQLQRSSWMGRLINYFSFTFMVFLKLFKIRKYRCVIVYSNPPILPLIPIIGNMLFGVKFIFVAYDIYPEIAIATKAIEADGAISKAMNKINKRLYRDADKIVVLTDEMKYFLLSNRQNLDKSKVRTIANWAHEGKLSSTKASYDRFGFQPDQLIVSYFGNMGTCQDMDTLIEVIRELEESDRIHFLIVGHGNKKQFVESELKDLKNVKIYDYMTGNSFEEAISISSVSIVSLEKGLMGLCAPSKYYSYLQGGQPVLAIVEEQSYLAKEIQEMEIGFSVKQGDAKRLKEILVYLAGHPEECKKMGNRAKQLYDRKYAKKIGLDKYCSLVKEVIKYD